MHEKVGKLSKDSDRRIHSDPVNHTKCHYFRPFPGDRKQTRCQKPWSKSTVKSLGTERASGNVCKARQVGRGRSFKERTLDTCGSKADVEYEEDRGTAGKQRPVTKQGYAPRACLTIWTQKTGASEEYRLKVETGESKLKKKSIYTDISQLGKLRAKGSSTIGFGLLWSGETRP